MNVRNSKAIGFNYISLVDLPNDPNCKKTPSITFKLSANRTNGKYLMAAGKYRDELRKLGKSHQTSTAKTNEIVITIKSARKVARAIEIFIDAANSDTDNRYKAI